MWHAADCLRIITRAASLHAASCRALHSAAFKPSHPSVCACHSCPRHGVITATKSPGRRCERWWLQGLLARRYTACCTRPASACAAPPRRHRRHLLLLSSTPRAAPCSVRCSVAARVLQLARHCSQLKCQVHHYPPTISPALLSVTWTCGRTASGCGAVMWPRGQLGRSSHGAHLLLQQRHA
jgi:hypothetical protein